MQINTALILCAGFGNRLHPLTQETPKPLLKIKEITLLEKTMSFIEKLKINKIKLNTFHLSNKIEKFANKLNTKIKIELIDKQRDIVKPLVEKHKGEWLKEIGDGLLFSFDSSLDAVNCSIEIQQNLKDINDLKIRIGIHQGDVFIKNGDVFGDDINIGARIEPYSPVGGIAVSEKVKMELSLN